MPQVNVEFDDDTVRSLDRIAAKQSIRRPELLRRTVRELIDADGSGREPFTAVVQEVTAEDVAHLAREHRQLTIELERVMRANDKREGELRKAEAELRQVIAAYEQDAAAARERGERELRDALERELAPFRAEIAALKGDLTTALASQPRLDAIDAELGEVKRLASQPRTQRNLVLGDDRTLSFRFLSALGLMMSVIGAVFILCFGKLVPAIGVPMVSQTLSGDPEVCRFIDYRYGRLDCQVPESRRIDRTLPRTRGRSASGKASSR